MAQVGANPVITELRERLLHLESNQARRRQTHRSASARLMTTYWWRTVPLGRSTNSAGGGAGTIDGAGSRAARRRDRRANEG